MKIRKCRECQRETTTAPDGVLVHRGTLSPYCATGQATVALERRYEGKKATR